jgi:hypothetical protein
MELRDGERETEKEGDYYDKKFNQSYKNNKIFTYILMEVKKEYITSK